MAAAAESAEGFFTSRPGRSLAFGCSFLACLLAAGALTITLLGRPGGNISPDTFTEYDDAIVKVVIKEEGLTHLPVVTNMDFGHTDPMFVLPYGVMAQIDCDTQQFAILESGVTD